MTGNGAGGLRVLVADDNRDSADACAVVLRLEGHQVRVAYSGSDALTIGAEFRPQMVLLDLAMPSMDGYAAARQIRASDWGSATTLVAVTGHGQAEDLRKTRENGFDHHLVKAADFSLLQRLLEQHADSNPGR
jgi:CheY-like chemotaxis protein